MENLSPSETVSEEQPKVRVIQGVPTSVIAVIGLFEKGPMGVPTFVAGPDALSEIFGGEVAGLKGRKAIGRFLENGGRSLYVTRTAHYTDIADPSSVTAISAKAIIDDRLPNEGRKASGNIKVNANIFTNWLKAVGYIEIASNVFDDGDKITIGDVDFIQGTTFQVGSDSTATAVNLMNAINGSLDAKIDGVLTASIDISNANRVLLNSVAFGVAGNALTLEKTDGDTENFNISGATLSGGIDGDTITVGTTVLKFGEHIIVGASTESTALAIKNVINAISGITAQIDAKDASKILINNDVVGAVGNNVALTKKEPSNSVVLSVGGTLKGGADTDSEISLEVVASDGAGIHANGRSVKFSTSKNKKDNHFRVDVYDASGSFLDSFDNVNLIPDSSDYVETRVNGKQKKLINIINKMSSNIESNNNLPLEGTFSLNGGNDGLLGLNDIDFIGSASAKTGMFSWDKIEDRFALSAIPDRPTAQVQNFALSRARAKKHFAHIIDAPDFLSPQELVNWKSDFGVTSEYGAFHYPWINFQDRDPKAKGKLVRLPNSMSIAALYASVDVAVGKGVSKTAAGVVDGRIGGAISATDSSYEQKENRDLVFPEGINPIWAEPGIGLINDGGRLSKLDGLVSNFAERRVFIYCETSIKLGTRYARHESIDEKLYNSLEASTNLFLRNFWKAGGLKGSTASEGYYIDISRGEGALNSPAVQAEQKVKMKFGLATKKPNYWTDLSFTVDQRDVLNELNS